MDQKIYKIKKKFQDSKAEEKVCYIIHEDNGDRLLIKPINLDMSITPIDLVGKNMIREVKSEKEKKKCLRGI